MVTFINVWFSIDVVFNLDLYEVAIMIEKRFTKQEVYDGINRYQINESNFIVEILDDGIPMHYSTIVNRLNKQHKTITRLEKENEQLKQLQNELYDFRMVYNALLFNNWHKHNEIEVYKSRRHNDGTFIYEWFIVVAILPDGKQVTNHYHIKYWDYFKIPEYTMVKDKFDGHTSQDVLDRLKSWLND